MDFSWDPLKAQLNKAKHGVSFSLAARVWDDPHYRLDPDRIEDGEERWHAIGTVGTVVLLVVHAYLDSETDEVIRIIGARKATPKERRRYEQERF